METNQDNKMACFRNVLSEPLQLQGDWKIALAEIIHPTGNKNVTTSEYIIYTPKTPSDMVPKTTKHSDATTIKRENWSHNALFPVGEYIGVEKILKQLKKGHESRKPLGTQLFWMTIT